MDRKGVTLKVVSVILIIFSFIAILTVVIMNLSKEDVQRFGESTTCKLNFIQTPDLTRLKCDEIPVEIKANNEEEAKEEILDLIIKMSKDFLIEKKFTENAGIIFKDTFCKKRYYPISFTNNLEITNFKRYLLEKLPDKLKNRVEVPDIINTKRVYSLVLVVVSKTYFDTWIDKGVWGAIKAGAWKGVESDYIGFTLVDVSEIGKLECNNPI